MFDELENVGVTTLVFIIFSVLIFAMLNFWRSQGMKISMFTQVIIQLAVLPLTYFIINYFANK